AASPAPPPPTAPPAPRDLLVSFLAQHDAPCPRCGYCLRGVESRTCPECGESLALQLSRRSTLHLRDGDFRYFLLLGFGWPMLAGLMNGFRAFQQARAIASFYGSRQNVVSSGWELVDWSVWLRLGWSLYLALAGAAGLCVVVWHWSRPCAITRTLKIAHACLFVFGVYLAWHVAWFAIELIQ
ncbi:MAG: hypothetical protein AB7G11_16735, partial [Phycisphaerales bacterium]